MFLSIELVTLYWPFSSLLSFLVERRWGFRSFVIDFLFVENGKDVYLHGANNSSLLTRRILVACRCCTVQCPVESVYGEVMPRGHDYAVLGRWAMIQKNWVIWLIYRDTNTQKRAKNRVIRFADSIFHYHQCQEQ